MAALKAGSIIDMGGSMAAMIEDAMHEEWRLAYPGQSLPGALGERDRKVLFAAVAKGVLRYLHRHRAEIDTTIYRFEDGDIHHHHELSFDLVEKVSGS